MGDPIVEIELPDSKGILRSEKYYQDITPKPHGIEMRPGNTNNDQIKEFERKSAEKNVREDAWANLSPEEVDKRQIEQEVDIVSDVFTSMFKHTENQPVSRTCKLKPDGSFPQEDADGFVAPLIELFAQKPERLLRIAQGLQSKNPAWGFKFTLDQVQNTFAYTLSPTPLPTTVPQ